jgi:hypothetical protein
VWAFREFEVIRAMIGTDNVKERVTFVVAQFQE